MPRPKNQPTKAQRDRVARIRRDFGKPYPKVSAPLPPHGHIRVQITCMAGLWQWYFDRDGNYVSGYLTSRLFDMPAPEHRSKNAIDN